VVKIEAIKLIRKITKNIVLIISLFRIPSLTQPSLIKLNLSFTLLQLS